MEKINIKGLNEDIYYEKLSNGLEVFLYTNPNIHNNYVTFTTKYGSIYNEFVPLNSKKMTTFPKGIAHFLEHKVFAQKEDPQPMEFFAQSGAICNAYTTFQNTTYLFYATSKLEENINYLLDYVQNIYLTDESVEDEKGIISEEIHMYDDRPYEVLAEKIRQNALIDNPYKDSVIGTTADIKKITKEYLETCYQTFYHPSNMFFVASGNFNPEKIMDIIRKNQSQKEYPTFGKIKVKEFHEEDKVARKREVIKVSTAIPKVSYTIKIPLSTISLSRRTLHQYCYILFSSLFDETSLFDEELKKDGIINSTTSISFLNTNTHMLVSFVSETEKYEEFLDRVKKRLSDLHISEDEFKRKQKVLFSNQIFAYENAETVGEIIIDSIVYDGKIEDDPIGDIMALSYEEFNDLFSKIDISNTSVIILKKE